MKRRDEGDSSLSKWEIPIWIALSSFFIIGLVVVSSLVFLYLAQSIISIGIYKPSESIALSFDDAIFQLSYIGIFVSAVLSVAFTALEKNARKKGLKRRSLIFRIIAMAFFILCILSLLVYVVSGAFVFLRDLPIAIVFFISFLLPIPAILAWAKANKLAISKDETWREKGIEKYEFIAAYSMSFVSIGLAIIMAFSQAALSSEDKDAHDGEEALYVEVLPDANDGADSATQFEETRFSNLEEIGSFIVRSKFDSKEIYYVVSEYDGNNKRVYVVEAPLVESAHSFFEFLPSDQVED